MTPLQVKRRHMLIVEAGCIACRKIGFVMTPEEHHLNFDGKAGQARRGPQFTIGLCRWHHRGEPIFPTRNPSVEFTRRMLGASLKHESIRFRQQFGDDDKLLTETNRIIGGGVK